MPPRGPRLWGTDPLVCPHNTANREQAQRGRAGPAGGERLQATSSACPLVAITLAVVSFPCLLLCLSPATCSSLSFQPMKHLPMPLASQHNPDTVWPSPAPHSGTSPGWQPPHWPHTPQTNWGEKPPNQTLLRPPPRQILPRARVGERTHKAQTSVPSKHLC